MMFADACCLPAATPNTTARYRDDRQPLNKPIRTAKTWFPQHLRYFHVSFTRIDHEEKKNAEGRLTNADHVRIFNHLFPEMVSTDYSHRHLREQWDGRLNKARSKDWFDIVRPNKKRKDGYTDDDLAKFAHVADEIQEAADALGIHVPWIDNKFVSGEKNPVTGSGDGAEEDDVEQVEDEDRGEEDVGDKEGPDGMNDPQEDDDQLQTEEPAEDTITNEESDHSDGEGVRLGQDADEETIDADGDQEPQLDLPGDGIATVLDDDLQQAESEDRESDHETRSGVADAQAHRGAESDSDVEFVSEGPALTQEEDDDVIMGNGNALEAQSEVGQIQSPTPATANPSADHEPLAPATRRPGATEDSHVELCSLPWRLTVDAPPVTKQTSLKSIAHLV